MLTINDVNLQNKKVLIREDFNVPIKDGVVTSDVRIKAALPTIKKAIENNCEVILMSHLGRPEEGEFDEKYSLAPVAVTLSNLLGQKVKLVSDWQENGVKINNGEVALLENVRFLVGESENSEELARQYASLADIFIMDAFASAHRKHASTYGVAEFAKTSCAGPLLIEEVKQISKAIEDPKRPLVAVVGGSKVSTKMEILDGLSKKADHIILGGGLANTFIEASGLSIGKSLIEQDLVNFARNLIRELQSRGGDIPMPVDVVVAKDLDENATAEIKSISNVVAEDMILDIGPDTIKNFCKYFADAGTIIWNGPLGVFEYEQFANGTKEIGKAIAQSEAYTLAGGGDTLAAIDKYGLQDQISYISTGGGAFLEFIAGKELPAIEILEKRNNVT